MATGKSLSSAPAKSAAEIVAAIPDDHTALVEFIAAEGAPITAFVLQRSGIRVRVLPHSTHWPRASRIRCAPRERRRRRTSGRSLGAALVDPVLPLLDERVTRIVVVPDGPLHRLPFDAMRLADGRYLFEPYAVGLAPVGCCARHAVG